MIEGADEIVVADDSKTTETRELIWRDDKNVIWVQSPRKGTAANRNGGARASSGDWLVFVDYDCLPSEHCHSEIRNATAGRDLIEGKTICPDKIDHPSET